MYLTEIIVVSFKLDCTVFLGGEPGNIDSGNGLLLSKQAGNKPSPDHDRGPSRVTSRKCLKI